MSKNIFLYLVTLRQGVVLGGLLLFFVGLGTAQAQVEPPVPTFEDAVTIGIGEDETVALVLGDVDNDGRLDVVTGSSESVNRLYLNDETGAFEAERPFGADDGLTQGLAVADINRDGFLDILVGNWGQQNAVYLNDGLGNFYTGVLDCDLAEQIRCFGSGDDTTESVAVVDLDRDGFLDIVVGNKAQQSALYLNDGAGNFHVGDVDCHLTSQIRCFGAGTQQTRAVAVGDVDGDGFVDIAVGNNEQQNVVYVNDGNGRFETDGPDCGHSRQLCFGSGGDSTYSVSVGDVDGDTDLDLAVGNREAPNAIYLNDGQGDFASERVFDGRSFRTHHMVLGDMDRDDDLDLVIGNGEQQNFVFYNDGDGQFSRWRSFGLGSDNSTTVAVGDIDQDGHLDIVVGNQEQQNFAYLNDGAGAFTAGRDFGAQEDNSSVVVADLNGDSYLDVVVGNTAEANAVYLNDGGGFLAFEQFLDDPARSTRSIAAADLNGDTYLDLIIGNQWQQNIIYFNDGSGGFQQEQQVSSRAERTLVIVTADLDGDNDLDIVEGNWGQANRIFYNDGSGNFPQSTTWGSGSDATYSVAVGDIEGDGDLDLVAGDGTQQNVAYVNGGSGDFFQGDVDCEHISQLRCFGTGTDETRGLAVGDLNSDGYVDIAVGNNEGEQGFVYLNDGWGHFLAGHPFTRRGVPILSLAIGEMSGDGYLDLIAGAWGQQNVVYLNDGQAGFATERFFGVESDETSGVAIGDMDRDGDSDIVISNNRRPSSIYLNGLTVAPPVSDRPPTVVLTGPELGPVANFYATPIVIKEPVIDIPFRLFDPEGDSVRFIRAYYATNGGGQWLPATLTAETVTDNLATAPWPEGAAHTIFWQAEQDLIKSDNVVFRIEAYQGLGNGGPYERSFAAAYSFPFRVETAERYAKVVDTAGQPMEGATVYQAGQLLMQREDVVDRTDRAGLMRLVEPSLGQPIVALQQMAEQGTVREAHDGWAYRTYITSLNLDNEGDAQPSLVGEEGAQFITIRPDDPLILFNIVVSVEWNADEIYLDMIARAFERASDYLYDVTDGQMAFGQVSIYDNRRHWDDADFQIATKNTVRPYAFISGILADEPGQSIRVGRFWDGGSGDSGNWDEPNGYRTLIHEFGHYALHLYDEYFVRTFDENGGISGLNAAACTGIEVYDNELDATNASMMYYQYNASELADRDRWGFNCQQTEQARVNGEPDWETVVRYYGDGQDEPRWVLNTPVSRGSVMAGPEQFPRELLPFPEIEQHDVGDSEAPARQLTVSYPNGAAASATIVALRTTTPSGTIVIDQGLTNANGQIVVYGALVGDIVQGVSVNGAFFGQVMITSAVDYQMILEPSSRAYQHSLLERFVSNQEAVARQQRRIDLQTGQESYLVSNDGRVELIFDVHHGAQGGQILIAPATYERVGRSENILPIGVAYEISIVTPSGARLSHPALLTMAIQPDIVEDWRRLAVYRWDNAQKQWTLVGGEVQGPLMTTFIEQSGTYMLGMPQNQIGVPEFAPDKSWVQ